MAGPPVPVGGGGFFPQNRWRMHVDLAIISAASVTRSSEVGWMRLLPEMRNAIVTATDSKYLPAACCALQSCVGDGRADARANLFLLACDVTVDDTKKADSFLRSRGVAAEIIVVAADRFHPFRIDGYVSASTYSRLLLPEFFDDQWDRLLYVDADARVMAPLQTLLDANLGGRPLGAVHDYLQYLIYGVGSSRTRLGLRSDAPYFNAGVMCFDWRATIASGLLQKAKAFAVESPHLCKSHDQDALNKAFEGAWAPLDPRWNFMTVAVPQKVLRLDYPARFRPYIAHFAGPVKPWTAGFPARYEVHRAWYRDQLHDSPWPNFVAPANAQLDELPAPSRVDRLTDWFSTQNEKLRAALERLSATDAATPRVPRNGARRKSYPSEPSTDGQANPALEHLLEEMVSEATESDTDIAK
jgi:lipopolysaccharide biosynthesis glycosyltransferase